MTRVYTLGFNRNDIGVASAAVHAAVRGHPAS